ncbi:hypothetical protein DB32_002432 [Sandaracinus amylolyticus]|uniref:Uncharacterized protein n=1 Tax=Sandaracinus amylolyticus TaxID=927083 RepID=A0A0F6W211_9BACT|nr:hypothetical protein DB32_002432 [Sandaracinus amylolyticus]
MPPVLLGAPPRPGSAVVGRGNVQRSIHGATHRVSTDARS